MRELVAYVMQSPFRAGVAALIAALVPFFFWFSAGLVALVTLRHGVSKGASTLGWAGLGSLVWLSQGDPGVLTVVVMAFLMAATLRTQRSLEWSLYAGVIATLILGSVIPSVMPELIDGLTAVAEDVFKQLNEESGTEYDEETISSVRSIMIASFAATYFVISIVSLFLGRSWQAHLDNPGGWRAEFHHFRLTSKFLLALMVLFLLTPVIGADPALVSVIALVPFLIAGIALAHGIIGKKSLGGQWLVIFYLSSLLLGPTALFMLIVAALLDSGVNFRARIEAKQQ